jgi:hypothetical protein
VGTAFDYVATVSGEVTRKLAMNLRVGILGCLLGVAACNFRVVSNDHKGPILCTGVRQETEEIRACRSTKVVPTNEIRASKKSCSHVRTSRPEKVLSTNISFLHTASALHDASRFATPASCRPNTPLQAAGGIVTEVA